MYTHTQMHMCTHHFTHTHTHTRAHTHAHRYSLLHLAAGLGHAQCLTQLLESRAPLSTAEESANKDRTHGKICAIHGKIRAHLFSRDVPNFTCAQTSKVTGAELRMHSL